MESGNEGVLKDHVEEVGGAKEEVTTAVAAENIDNIDVISSTNASALGILDNDNDLKISQNGGELPLEASDIDKVQASTELIEDKNDAEVASIHDDSHRLRVSSNNQKPQEKVGLENESPDKNEVNDGDKKSKTSNSLGLFTKIVFRNLPPTLSAEEFLEVIDPDINDIDYFHYTYADKFYGFESVSTAHINFVDPDIAELYIVRFDGYIIVDHSGYEFTISVEYSLNQSIPKANSKVDTIAGTIEDTEDFKKFCEAFDEYAEGIIGERPQFSDAKAMSDQLLKQIEEKEEKKGELPSTPLLDSIRERLRTERAKLTKERDQIAERRKERERLRTIRKEKRRERREQERKDREKRDKERRERERRERENKIKQEKGSEKQVGEEEKNHAPLTVSKESNKSEVTKNEQDSGKKQGDEVKSGSTDKPEVKQDKSSASSSSSKTKDSYRQERGRHSTNYKEKDYVPRRSYNDRRPYSEKYQSTDDRVERNKPFNKKYDGRVSSNGKKNNSTLSKSGETSEVSEVTKSASSSQGKSTASTSETVAPESKAEGVKEVKEDVLSKDSTSEKPKKKIVKKIVKVVRAKGNNGDSKFIEKSEVAKKPDDNSTTNKDSTSSENPTGTKLETNSSSQKSADRPRKGRPDMQIYRPGSWRQNTSSSAGGNKSSASGNNTAKSSSSSNICKTESANQADDSTGPSQKSHSISKADNTTSENRNEKVESIQKE